MDTTFEPTLEQKAIFRFLQQYRNHGIIDAVAGSGKTKTITESIKFIPKSKSILFCAFNKKIQTEISKKTKGNLNVKVKTTYSLGLNILKDNNFIFKNSEVIENKYSDIYYTALKSKDQENIEYKEEFEILALNHKKLIALKHKYFKDQGVSLDEVNLSNQIIKISISLTNLLRLTLSYGQKESAIKKIAEDYGLEVDLTNSHEIEYFSQIIEVLISTGVDIALKKGMIDFVDMLFLPHFLKYPSKTKYDFIFIDECQDLSNAQLNIVLSFYDKQKTRIFAVGDPFQSIYGFAGASPKSFSNIKTVLKPDEFKLTNCFRCGDKIVEKAAEIREDISTKNTFQNQVLPINYNQIFDKVTNGDLIISRFNFDIVMTFFDLLRRGFDCKITGIEEIIDEIKNFVPQKYHKSKSFYEDLIENINKLYEVYTERYSENYLLLEKYKGIKDIIAYCYYEFQGKNQFIDIIENLRHKLNLSDSDCISLSSIHKAKGLEYNNVFILNYQELPFQPSSGGLKEWQQYQENCLKYVAITRAMINLYQVKGPDFKNEQHRLMNNEVDIESIEYLPF